MVDQSLTVTRYDAYQMRLGAKRLIADAAVGAGDMQVFGEGENGKGLVIHAVGRSYAIIGHVVDKASGEVIPDGEAFEGRETDVRYAIAVLDGGPLGDGQDHTRWEYLHEHMAFSVEEAYDIIKKDNAQLPELFSARTPIEIRNGNRARWMAGENVVQARRRKNGIRVRIANNPSQTRSYTSMLGEPESGRLAIADRVKNAVNGWLLTRVIQLTSQVVDKKYNSFEEVQADLPNLKPGLPETAKIKYAGTMTAFWPSVYGLFLRRKNEVPFSPKAAFARILMNFANVKPPKNGEEYGQFVDAAASVFDATTTAVIEGIKGGIHLAAGDKPTAVFMRSLTGSAYGGKVKDARQSGAVVTHADSCIWLDPKVNEMYQNGIQNVMPPLIACLVINPVMHKVRAETGYGLKLRNADGVEAIAVSDRVDGKGYGNEARASFFVQKPGEDQLYGFDVAVGGGWKNNDGVRLDGPLSYTENEAIQELVRMKHAEDLLQVRISEVVARANAGGSTGVRAAAGVNSGADVRQGRGLEKGMGGPEEFQRSAQPGPGGVIADIFPAGAEPSPGAE